jgi:hypothetical protein
LADILAIEDRIQPRIIIERAIGGGYANKTGTAVSLISSLCLHTSIQQRQIV